MPTATLAPTATPCSTCGEPVLHRYTTAQRAVTLDAEPLAGGLYRIDRHGRAERRSLVLLYQEQRAGLRTLGYEVHECTPEPQWYDRD